ncbi:RNase P subunit p30-like protein [Elsinoe fawcettii]|nr:RNase P subunit p30-like protein [Elsinoe fawcettii]
MFYDLNIPFTSASDPELPRILHFLSELGYTTIALNHTLSSKLPATLTSPIPRALPFTAPTNLTILHRLTLPLTTPLSNARLKSLAADYDLLALRPTDEKTFQQACSTLDADIISLDLSQRLPFVFKFKPLSEAVKRGVRIEINYAQALSGDANARRNVISSVTGLVRASRGRGLVVGSEARRAVECRAPWDVVNLLAVWGLGQERGYEAVTREARGVVVVAELKRRGWRGVVDVVEGGEDERVDTEQTDKEGKEARAKAEKSNGKRKAEEMEDIPAPTTQVDKPLSKREMKRRAKAAKEAAAAVKE